MFSLFLNDLSVAVFLRDEDESCENLFYITYITVREAQGDYITLSGQKKLKCILYSFPLFITLVFFFLYRMEYREAGSSQSV